MSSKPLNWNLRGTLEEPVMSDDRIEGFDMILDQPFRHSSLVGRQSFPTQVFLTNNVDALEQRNVLRDQVGKVHKARTIRRLATK